MIDEKDRDWYLNKTIFDIPFIGCYGWLDEDDIGLFFSDNGDRPSVVSLLRLHRALINTLKMTDENWECIHEWEQKRVAEEFAKHEMTPHPVEIKNGYVYLIKTGPLHKVGISKSQPESRLRQYKTANPFPVEVLICTKCKGYSNVESDILSRYSDKVAKGAEWLDITDVEAAEIVSFITERAVV